MREITMKIYNYSELSDTAKERVINEMSDINTNHDWWEFVYEEAKSVGIVIESFDLYRGTIQASINDMDATAKTIMLNHGKDCETYHLAKSYLTDFQEENIDFMKDAYLSILTNEYDYLTSEKAIIETIEANEYEFYEDGALFQDIIIKNS